MEGQPLATAPTATPIPLQIGKPVCYLTADEGAWCFALVTNSSSQDVENVSGWIGLNTSQEENKAGQIAYAPLNLLSAGQTMPLVTFMPPPLPVQFDAYATILTALPVQEADLRYLPARLNIIENSLSPDGKSGRSRGKIKIPASSPPANTAWVLVVAYAQDGQVAGVRKWEAGTQGTCAGFASTATAYPTEASTPWGGLAKECLSFDTTVYSLGPIITHLEVFVEARH